MLFLIVANAFGEWMGIYRLDRTTSNKKHDEKFQNTNLAANFWRIQFGNANFIWFWL